LHGEDGGAGEVEVAFAVAADASGEAEVPHPFEGVVGEEVTAVVNLLVSELEVLQLF